MFEFAWPWMVFLLPLPWLVRFFLPTLRQADEGVLTIPFYSRLQKVGSKTGSLSWLQVSLAMLMWVLLVLAVMRPEWLGEPVQIERSGRDIFLAIDISGSMRADDLVSNGVKKTRLGVVQDVATRFLVERKGDRIGLILFGTRAYTQTPLTFDRDATVDMLNDATIGLAGQSTAIGDSIGLAIKRLMEEPSDSRVLILMTDGASNAGSVKPLEAAKLAAEENIKIYTVGLGAKSVVRETFFGQQRVNPSRDLDEGTLKKIAAQTGGLYFRATDEAALESIYSAISELEPISTDNQFFQPIYPLYVWPLGMAFLLVMLLLFMNQSGRWGSV